MDLASLSSVKRFTDSWIATGRKIDELVCNAGIQLSGGSKALSTRTEDDFECTMGTNHIGHFALLPAVFGCLVWLGSGVHNPQEPGEDVGSKASKPEMGEKLSTATEKLVKPFLANVLRS
jgi:NAD(P)-dependent dehydrogenase (short-subunit alcohol dehydrogenase family)